MAPSLVDHVVADAGAFLKRAPLQDIGRNIYTLKDVVDEIRDKQTRKSLAFLPYQLHFKEPHPEHIRQVTEFSKKTGDYPSLSATDIKVLALTFQLELEHVGSEHLKTQPDNQIDVQSTRRHPEAPVNIAGFHFPSKKPSEPPTPRLSQSEPETLSDQFNSFQFWREPLPPLDLQLLDSLAPVDCLKAEDKQTSCLDSNSQFNSFLFWRNPPTAFSEELLGLLTQQGAELRESDHQSEEDEEKEDEEDGGDEDDEDEDGGGWITPSNIQQAKMDSSDWTEPADVTVGCLTTDFAMQNVLLQIGLHVLSVNGLLIKQARSYILRCHACFRTTSNMMKVFCPHCGNNTLKKLAVSVNQDGSTQMHFSKNPKVLNPRGLRHSLPQPQGGKHSNNPLLVEDQRFPQQRVSKQARQKTDVFDPDYVAGASPFSVNDVYSRAANLHIRDGHGGGQRRANPNAPRRKSKRK